MLPRAIWGEGVPKPTGNAPRGGSIEGRPNFVWVILGDLDRFKRARVLGFIRPVVPLAGLLLYLETSPDKPETIDFFRIVKALARRWGDVTASAAHPHNAPSYSTSSCTRP